VSILSNFFFFGVKLGHFTINNFFLYVTKTQAYQQKTEKFLVSEEKSLVGSIPGVNFNNILRVPFVPIFLRQKNSKPKLN